MKIKTRIIITTVLAAMMMGRSAAAEDGASYPVLAYAAPSERPLISMHATPGRIDYRTEASLFSSPTTTARAEEGLLVEWRDRVFRSLAANMTPNAADGERTVARIALKESMNLALQHFPSLDRLIRVLKLEVSTDMLGRDEVQDKGEEALPLAPAPVRSQPVHRFAKERFFMKTGLRIPIEKGKPALLSETSAVYGSIATYVNVRIDGKLGSSLGFRYTVSRDMRVQVERTVADAVDPVSGGTVQRAVSNMVTLVCVF